MTGAHTLSVADVLVVGQFALVRGYDRGLLDGEIWQVEKVTAKTATVTRKMWGTRRIELYDVIAAFDTEKDAERLRDTLAGIRGEMDRRVTAAKIAVNQSARAAIARATSKEAQDNG